MGGNSFMQEQQQKEEWPVARALGWQSRACGKRGGEGGRSVRLMHLECLVDLTTAFWCVRGRWKHRLLRPCLLAIARRRRLLLLLLAHRRRGRLHGVRRGCLRHQPRHESLVGKVLRIQVIPPAAGLE